MMEVLVEGTRIMQMAKLFRGRDIPFDVIMSDATACVDRTLDWRDFYPLHVVYSFLNDLEKEFPSTCTVSVIGRTVEGRDIKMLKISNSDANNTGIWLDGATHAREWISTAVVTYIADYLAKNFDTLSVNYTSKDWYFVPVVNPDGYQHTHTVDRMWRKNRAPSGNAVTGVDLNRNFGYKL
uniref:SFRICE_031639 n=1 Tax=Spodoptera frugiperda TaxID=7108 RepID=A0A2H1WSE0_SPOFR